MFVAQKTPRLTSAGRVLSNFGSLAIAVPEGLMALLPGIVLALLRRILRNDAYATSKRRRCIAVVTTVAAAIILTGLLVATVFGSVVLSVMALDRVNFFPKVGSEVLMITGGLVAEFKVLPSLRLQWSVAIGITYGLALFTPWFSTGLSESSFGLLGKLLAFRIRLVRFLALILGAVILLGLSLLPLAALLLVLPAIYSQENVLTDATRDHKNLWWKSLRRLFYFLTGVALMLALLAFSVEFVTRLNLHSPYFGKLARMVLPDKLVNELPRAMIDQWPYVFIIIYATDMLMLFGIGKVPLNYNFRNLAVRWKTTVMTGLAFTVVLCLLTAMLAFVNGLNNLTSNSGIPGNVFVLSEGATDELFSSLSKQDIEKIENERTEYDSSGRRLPSPIKIKEIPGPSVTGKVRLCSYETYFVINQVVPVKRGEKPRRRFVQLRGIVDPYVSAKVHNIELLEGEWFGRSVDVDVGGGKTACPAVLGEGAAAKFAEDLGKPKLKIGDQFKLGDLDMVVGGIMKSEGSTFGSEVWATWDRVGKVFHKDQYTTVILRVNDDSEESARIMAKYLSADFKNPRVRAVDEKAYFEDLGKSNDSMLTSVILVAIIMAIGGVFGVMNTMFAAIAQRTKDIGVMRILGFKRWQILVSFMLESLGIAILGGVAGIAIGSLFNGFQMTSNVSSGQGGGKTVIMKLAVDADIMICGLLFTIVMGRVGGLVPALSAMRLRILESLK